MASAPAPTISDVLDQVSALLGRRDLLLQQEQAWAAGAVNGGPNGDGLYPIDDSTGFTRLIPCPAKIEAFVEQGVFTRMQLASTTVLPTIATVRTSGYNQAGDLGGATYYRVASDPGHHGSFQDVSGAWFAIRSVDVNAEVFGAFTDGTEHTAELQNGIDYLAGCVFGGTLRLSPGTYYAKDLVVRSQVEVVGAGMLKSTVACVANPARAIMYMAPAQSFTGFLDFTLDGLSVTTDPAGVSLLDIADFVSDVEIRRVRFANTRNRWALRNRPIQGSGATYKNLTICENRWSNCPSGGLLIQAVAKGNTNIKINDNWWDQTGSNLCQVSDIYARQSGELFGWNTHVGVEVCRNRVTNCLNTGTAGPIPFELWGCTDIEHNDNFLDSGTRGLTAGAGMTNGIVARNIVLNQTIYACEAGSATNVKFVENTAINCQSLINFTDAIPDPSNPPLVTNYTIARNKFSGSGNTAYNAAGPSNVLSLGNGMLFDGMYIIGNEMRGCDYIRNPIQVWFASGSKVYVEGNTIIADSPYASLRYINSRCVGGDGHAIIEIRRNVLRRTADVPSDHYQGSGVDTPAIQPHYATTDPSGFPFYSSVVEDNEIDQQGNYTTNTQICGIGSISGSTPKYGVTIRRNILKGKMQRGAIFFQDNSGTSRVLDNDVDGITSGPTYVLDPSTVIRKTLQMVEGTSAPTTGAWRDGAICWNSSPSRTAAEFWQYSAASGSWIARYAPGLDPTIPATYALLSTLTTASRFTMVSQGSGLEAGTDIPTLKLRCEALASTDQIETARFDIKWLGRHNNDSPQGGTITLSYGTYSGALSGRYPVTSHSEIASSPAPTITTALDSAGRIETTIAFPTTFGAGGIVVQVDCLCAYGSNIAPFSDFSAQLA